MVLLKALHLLGRSRLQVYRALCSHSATAMEHLLVHLPRGRCDKFGILFPYSNFLQTRRSARSPTRKVMSLDVLARWVLNNLYFCRYGPPSGSPPEQKGYPGQQYHQQRPSQGGYPGQQAHSGGGYPGQQQARPP
jgi:hypothetical protein